MIAAEHLARTTDPRTSKLAARAVVKTLPQARLKALRAIASTGEATYHDVIGAASYGRITELNRLGLIECIGTREVLGRQARVFRVTDAGEEALGG